MLNYGVPLWSVRDFPDSRACCCTNERRCLSVRYTTFPGGWARCCAGATTRMQRILGVQLQSTHGSTFTVVLGRCGVSIFSVVAVISV